MAKAANAKSRQRVKRLYFSAKISDYQFKKVLWHFVLDHSAVETAKHISLNANSVSAIYAKLRKFFFDYGLFRDPYKGGDPRDGLPHEGFEDIEHLILAFHLKRVTDKHGSLDSAMNAPDYHFSESSWRYNFDSLQKERGLELVQLKMFENIMEFIRCFGPVGRSGEVSRGDQLTGSRLALEQMDRRILWLERNSVKLQNAEKRIALQKLRGN